MTMPDSNQPLPGLNEDQLKQMYKDSTTPWGLDAWKTNDDGTVTVPMQHLQDMLENTPGSYHPVVQSNYLMYKSLPGWPSSFGSTNAFEAKPPQVHQYANWPMDATSAHNKIMSGLTP